MKFQLHRTDGRARRATLSLAHGTVETPAFMPVGTYGAVKTMSPADLREINAHIVLGNTFHLWLRPGLEVIGAHNGLHHFMGWDGPVLTDSGGFQVFSLGGAEKDHRRRRQVQVAGKWRRVFSHPGGIDAYSTHTQFRHRDDIRRMHAIPRGRARCA
jgi:tRNA-guanine family transglycosylase